VIDAGNLGARDPFFELLAFTRVFPVPQTVDEMVKGSDVIASAHFDDVMDGRVIDFAEGASNPMYTAVFKLSIDASIKGPSIPFAYVEFVRGGIPVERMKKLPPREMPIVVLLRPADDGGWDQATYKFENGGSGFPPSEILRTFLYPAGIIVESSTGLEYPLADDPGQRILDGNTLTDAEQELADLSAR
jgi:hypothetical protein